jgi:hypothetical protein
MLPCSTFGQVEKGHAVVAWRGRIKQVVSKTVAGRTTLIQPEIGRTGKSAATAAKKEGPRVCTSRPFDLVALTSMPTMAFSKSVLLDNHIM